ncbi:pyridoxamine 5'-phosphate oxidase family protein [Paenibacillus sp. FA6]|uniref:pyridoxamine 5'-phosphate oxidase family protein n=1 Tax=Paenibacillus sp. FA6 TaxID=3413029 RepID=UPI003F65736B
MSESVTQMTDTLLSQLKSETFVLLNTIDVETGGPTSSAISWIYALNASTLRLAIDHRSRLVENIRNNPLVTITVFADGKVHAINGRASIVLDPLPEVPFKLCCFDISIEAVRNALFYGAQLSSAPQYIKTYDQRASEKLDGQVFSAMQKA